MFEAKSSYNCEYSPHSEDAKVSQKSRIDGETTGGRIHARYVLAFLNVLQGEFGSIVPVPVVQMLTDKCVRLDGTVAVNLEESIAQISHIQITLWNPPSVRAVFSTSGMFISSMK